MNSVTDITGLHALTYSTTGNKTQTDKQEPSVNFSEVLAETAKEQAVQAAASAVAGGSSDLLTGGYLSGLGGGGLEQAILNASASGEISDAQIALFMLCMMMQTNQNGDFSPLMPLMSSMIAGLTGDTETLRSTIMSSDYSPYVLDTIDKEVFGTKMPEVSDTGKAILPTEAWKPATPAITNTADNRSAENLQAVIDQFNVETAERYRPYRNGKDTYCNIFVWDVTSALGAEIPHYINPDTGEPMYYPNVKGAQELGAIAIDEWLLEHGEKYGWRQVDAETAQRYANEGKPAVTTAGKNRHVQVVCPSKDGGFDPIRGVTVAQAGAKVVNYTHLSSIYSANGQKSVKYFVHD